ncbi:low molecular weight protein tyrosine phosphatase family protein [Beggiatoa leptomitoformis]|uniref:Phosphotyrosine protein phosphatase n=1 Tax=Beggiatoa leptomitoformis TaxID=288004 RepID=A0A2N9YGE4_9GAMM|nr:low molecular weight protein tyrosine phosphatase family protein [Beggiatoa leptomitoformis]ALG68111.1 phosphotyrosine protein phosphatase [Beggiatoa leptomitoformis]AUI69592.1 phosphotyrosine protein phosphatase [Beggiatoa leptomitoformis]
MTIKILFICSQNKWRSPTAEQIFSENSAVECLSAGLNHDAENPLTPELVSWAEIIFVMERKHKEKLSTNYQAQLLNTRIICLNIKDNYKFMQPELIKLLKSKVTPFLPPI